MDDPREKGWLSVPGIREYADRTLEEQMLGLDLALSECKGKTVLDLGCAEGLIGREFARAGASWVLGIESVASHLVIARQVCAEYSRMEFIHANLNRYIPERMEMGVTKFDIVLALGVIHKLKLLDDGLRFAARSAGELLVFRPPGYERDGKFRSSNWGGLCDARLVLESEGFTERQRFPSCRDEHVEYWRR